MNDDDPIYTGLSNTTPKARKLYHCYCCNNEIEKGEKHRKYVIVTGKLFPSHDQSHL